ncbi:MAG: bifunctional (p)ppGpp synthetase/guanosine-3',5'-bis(diphosphate) 3'-pyrophosphohydrolase [Eubacteriaceae bacterium]|nr:bifunctional (p)ppGpp synthetase/guanosine-3',5'-bis(diphosphate) 3'-pyrophosphohydrolase [Eubacteriaceae bacterium]
METRQQFLNSIKEFNPNYNIEMIGRAYDVAAKMHEGQFRKSGEKYLIHPMAVAQILAELGMDEDTIIAGLLHDAIEDTEYTEEQLTDQFGEGICLMVDGVTKLGSLKFETKEERQAESLRKMFLAMSKDIRVLIIKLADRLHNLRTINYMSEKQIQNKCKETLDIYAPLASRLGIFTMKFELEDTAMKYLYPEAYADISKKVSAKKEERQAAIDKVLAEIDDSLKDLNIHYDISGRSKHFYSIYRKMKYQKKSIDEIFDLMAVRVIVDTVKDCYAVLGIVHTMWTPIPGRFKDYIAMPKPNMYQSLHTTVMGDNGSPFEIQIRTYEMHRVAEYGIAAHWKYKEGVSKDKEEVKMAWLRQALEWQKDTNNASEFMETLKVDLFVNQVYVFTPAGDVMELPADATPLDFAFKVHSDVGAKCIGAKVNGRMVPIDHKLGNGDIIEIMTSPNASGPSIDWLKIAKSSTARTKIRQWLKKQDKSDNVDKGKDALDKYVRKKGYNPGEVTKNSFILKAVKELNYSSVEEFYTQLSNGGTVVSKAAAVLFEYYESERVEEKLKEENTAENLTGSEEKTKKKKTKFRDNPGVIVKGADNLLIRLARCCNPVPGDEIIGFITKGRGISVHRKDCVNITSLPPNERARFIDVEWDSNKETSYEADITVIASDRKGLFSDLSKACESMDVHIAGVNTQKSKDGDLVVVLTLSIEDIPQMQKLLRVLKSIQGIEEVHRTRT